MVKEDSIYHGLIFQRQSNLEGLDIPDTVNILVPNKVSFMLKTKDSLLRTLITKIAVTGVKNVNIVVLSEFDRLNNAHIMLYEASEIYANDAITRLTEAIRKIRPYFNTNIVTFEQYRHLDFEG